MKVEELEIPGVRVLCPRRFHDARGFFEETWNARSAGAAGVTCGFVQDNHSFSRPAGTLRGLHCQMPPFAQDKLVMALTGRLLDVAVDVRSGSPSYGQWVSAELSAEAGNQIFVPSGFLHGFVTLEPDTHVLYKVSAHYSAEHEVSVMWNDPDLAIAWGVDDVELSPKDSAGIAFAGFRSPFVFGQD